MAQTTSSQPAEPTCRVISALTMKMPDPTMMPATIMIESNSPSALRNSCGAPCSLASDFEASSTVPGDWEVSEWVIVHRTCRRP